MAIQRHLQFRRNQSVYPDFASAKSAMETLATTKASELLDGEMLIARYTFSNAADLDDVETMVRQLYISGYTTAQSIINATNAAALSGGTDLNFDFNKDGVTTVSDVAKVSPYVTNATTWKQIINLDKLSSMAGLVHKDATTSAVTITILDYDYTLYDVNKSIQDVLTSVTWSSPENTITVEKSSTTGLLEAEVNIDKNTIKQSSGKTYDNGKVVVPNDELYASDAVIEDTFTVLGGTVGQLTSGTKISGGTTVIELLKQMLVKEADCTAVVPTCTLSINPTTSPVEVGTVVSETLSSTYTDGKFTGSKDDYGYAYSVNAGCAQGTVTYKRGTTVVTSPDSYTMPEGTTTWSCTSTYGASTVTPKKNNGADSTTTIAAGTTASSSKSITAQYKYYLGYTTASTASDINTTALIKALNTKSNWITVNGTTTIVDSNGITSNGTSIVLAIPNTYKLVDVFNSLGVSIKPNFVNSTTMTGGIGDEATTTYTNESTDTTYHIYMYPITSGVKVAFKNMTITKA